MSSQLRYPLLHGQQNIAAIWLPHQRYDELTRRQLIIRQWHSNATVWRFATGDLLRYANAVGMQCDHVHGWPLCWHGKTLCSALLDEKEARALPAADIWLIDGGEVIALMQGDGQLLNPAEWLNMSEYSLLEMQDFQSVLPAIEPVLQEHVRAVRAVFGDKIPGISPERAAFLNGLKAHQSQSIRGVPGRGSWAMAAISRVSAQPGIIVSALYFSGFIIFVSILAVEFPSSLDSLFTWLLLMVLWMLYFFIFKRNSYSSNNSQATASPIQQAATRLNARNQSQQPQRWRDWLSRLAVTSQLSKLLGRAQAAYMRKMLDMFENGQLDEALRHAIPLGGEQASLGQAFGMPKGRSSLQLSTQQSSSISINLGDELESYLRQLYRKSFEQLDRSGRIDEAAFVLAELLNSKNEALDYLEKHQRFQQAAELALGWDCSAETIVRLHCLAGDWHTAVLVAKRDQSFAGAVLQLEKRWPDAAKRLRLDWADNLVQQGLWLQAVEVVWPLEKERLRAIEWLQQAEQAEGQLSVQVLVKRALLLPDTLDLYDASIKHLREDPEQHTKRHALAASLLVVNREQHTPQSLALARMLVAPILADQHLGNGLLSKHELQNLLNLSGDKLLYADLPSKQLPIYQPRALRDRSSTLQCQAPEPGTQAIFDACLLNDGNLLLALGEAGALVVSAQGKRLFRLAVPCEKLVMAHSRNVALALVKRQQVWRVSRIDLVLRSAHDLGVCQFDFCADNFDGVSWTITRGSTMMVLDSSRSLQHVLWQVNDLPGTICGFSASPQFEQLLVESEQMGKSHWQYQLPQRRLIKREAISFIKEQINLLIPDGGLFCFSVRESTDQPCTMLSYQVKAQRLVNLPLSAFKLIALSVDAQWLGLTLQSEAGDSQFRLHNLNDGQQQLQLHWPQAQQLRQRFDQQNWLCFDDRGRLFRIELASSAVHTISLH